MILVHIDDVPGDCKLIGYEKKSDKGENTGWFVAESFTFGVQREMKGSSEKAGTEDINIGLGELQECNISKGMNRSSPHLAQFAISGNSLGTAFIDFVEVAGGNDTGKPLCYLRFKLDRCFVKSWTANGDSDSRPTEEVAFYYNKIAFQYLFTEDGRTFQNAGEMKWDNVANTPWESHGISLPLIMGKKAKQF